MERQRRRAAFIEASSFLMTAPHEMPKLARQLYSYYNLVIMLSGFQTSWVQFLFHSVDVWEEGVAKTRRRRTAFWRAPDKWMHSALAKGRTYITYVLRPFFVLKLSIWRCQRRGKPPFYIHYRSKVWDHLEMTLYFKEKHCFFNKDNIKLIRNTHYTLLMW